MKTYLWASVLCVLIAQPVAAQTMLEMQSWCEPVSAAQVRGDGMIKFPQTKETISCWSAFGAIQELSNIIPEKDAKPLLGFCAPEQSTTLQFIKVFLRYAANHPERMQDGFGRGALWSLTDAFPCSGKH